MIVINFPSSLNVFRFVLIVFVSVHCTIHVFVLLPLHLIYHFTRPEKVHHPFVGSSCYMFWRGGGTSFAVSSYYITLETILHETLLLEIFRQFTLGVLSKKTRCNCYYKYMMLTHRIQSK